MKVKVHFAQPTILIKREIYEAEQAEFEKLFQENKDLRVSEGHLRDDLACAKAQIEAQRQAILHRDEQLLNQFEEIKALEIRLEETTAELVKHELHHYKDEAEEWKMTADKLSEQLRELQAVLTDLQIEHQELGEDYDALVKTKCEYAEYIDTLRQENKRLRNQMPLPEFMRQFIEMTREAVQNEFPDSGNS